VAAAAGVRSLLRVPSEIGQGDVVLGVGRGDQGVEIAKSAKVLGVGHRGDLPLRGPGVLSKQVGIGAARHRRRRLTRAEHHHGRHGVAVRDGGGQVPEHLGFADPRDVADHLQGVDARLMRDATAEQGGKDHAEGKLEEGTHRARRPSVGDRWPT
jgi:hypothetical protein